MTELWHRNKLENFCMSIQIYLYHFFDITIISAKTGNQTDAGKTENLYRWMVMSIQIHLHCFFKYLIWSKWCIKFTTTTILHYRIDLANIKFARSKINSSHVILSTENRQLNLRHPSRHWLILAFFRMHFCSRDVSEHWLTFRWGQIYPKVCFL